VRTGIRWLRAWWAENARRALPRRSVHRASRGHSVGCYLNNATAERTEKVAGHAAPRVWPRLRGRRLSAVVAARSHRKSPEKLMCSQLSGDVWASHASGTDCSVARRWVMASAMSVEFQNTIAAMRRLRPEARNCCARHCGLVRRPCLPALFQGADDLREKMTLLALVEPGMAASAQFRAFEPVEHEQRAFDRLQLLECEVELVRAA